MLTLLLYLPLVKELLGVREDAVWQNSLPVFVPYPLGTSWVGLLNCLSDSLFIFIYDCPILHFDWLLLKYLLTGYLIVILYRWRRNRVT